LGAQLLAALCDEALARGAVEIRTAACWNEHAMLRWLDECGFRLAPERVVERRIEAGPAGEADDIQELAQPTALERASAYSRTVVVSAMQPGDLCDLVRIDRAWTHREREPYLRRRLAESLAESAVRVSLTARRGGVVAGFVMARVDAGDFGRFEPAAVIDSVGVEPSLVRQGVGRALLAQLCDNLAALAIERVETAVAPADLALLGFLQHAGFAPSQRLIFVRGVA
jgi:GNAT superfamily N-acetyltransferase